MRIWPSNPRIIIPLNNSLARWFFSEFSSKFSFRMNAFKPVCFPNDTLGFFQHQKSMRGYLAFIRIFTTTVDVGSRIFFCVQRRCTSRIYYGTVFWEKATRPSLPWKWFSLNLVRSAKFYNYKINWYFMFKVWEEII